MPNPPWSLGRHRMSHLTRRYFRLSCINALPKESWWGKVHFPTSNLYWSSIFNLQLWNRVTNTLQLSKPDKFGPRLVSKAVFYFRKVPKFYIIFLSLLTSSNEKNSKLQSYRSHWELQLWYKKYLHLTPYKKYIIFLIRQALLW